MEWVQDSLGIYFAQMKNDQAGERPKDPRHVFGNPFNFNICPLVALGLHMLCFTFDPSSPFVFAGGSQDDGFSKFFNAFLNIDWVLEFLAAHGL